MFIYGLYSTKDNVIKYVGKTKCTLHKRLIEHINGALRRNCNTYKDNWIRKTYNDGYKVEIKLIEECDNSIWESREKFWIANIKNLTNLTEGGESGHGNLYNVTYKEMKEYLTTLPFTITSKTLFYKYNHLLDVKYPKNPQEVFENRGEWVSWGDFLGTNRIQDNEKAKKYLTFNDAKKYLNKFAKLKSSKEYRIYIDKNNIEFLPKKPFRFYNGKGWNGWEDYLNVKKRYLISDELICRYLHMFFPKVTGNCTFRKYKHEIHRAIHFGRIRNFNFGLLKKES